MNPFDVLIEAIKNAVYEEPYTNRANRLASAIVDVIRDEILRHEQEKHNENL